MIFYNMEGLPAQRGLWSIVLLPGVPCLGGPISHVSWEVGSSKFGGPQVPPSRMRMRPDFHRPHRYRPGPVERRS